MLTAQDSTNNSDAKGASNWINLNTLDVSRNLLEETIAARPREQEFEYAHWLAALQRLELGETSCGGTIPDEFGELPLPLQVFAAKYTPMHGTLPVCRWEKHPQT